MVIVDHHKRAYSLPTRKTITETEWNLRCDLAAVYRLVAHYGMSDLIFTHISSRIPGRDHHFLINPYGLMFDEITASSLVKIDLHGNPIEDTPYTVNPAGFIIHSAVHSSREDALCVLHVHSRFGCAVSAQKQGLLPLNQISMQFYNRIGYHDYEGVALNRSEQKRIIADLGSYPVLILRNHGLLTVGIHPWEAFVRAYYLEKACQIQIEASVNSADLNIPDAAIAEHAAKQLNNEQTDDDFSDEKSPQLLYDAFKRLVERKYPDYAT